MSLPSGSDDENRGELPQRLVALRQQVERGNPEHYRQLALYLQVLRRVLPGAVDQACFHLATQIAPDRYAALPGLKRQSLHRRLDELVRQCSSLLTVEQLASLASRLAQDRLLEHLSQHRRWLEEHGGGEASEDPGAARQADDRPHGASGLPSGSVVLGMELPLGEAGTWFHAPVGPPSHMDEDGTHTAEAEADGGDDDDDDDHEDGEDAGPFPWALGFDFGVAGVRPLDANDAEDEAEELEEGTWPPQPDSPSHPSQAGFGIWGSLEPVLPAPEPTGSADGGESEPIAESPSSDADRLSMLRASIAAFVTASEEANGPDTPERPASGLPPTPWRSGALPKDPAHLLLWLEGFEQALTRRLRNLSHAINVEFLRQELSPTLLPPSLLDAVLAGRLEPQSAPANLLRLPLPLPAAAAAHGLIGHALLLRSGDLEAENPQLRTCRQRLQRQREELRRMALLQTRLQRRLRTQEAERLWMQTVRRTRTDSR